jgi:hypothetical protein
MPASKIAGTGKQKGNTSFQREDEPDRMPLKHLIEYMKTAFIK